MSNTKKGKLQVVTNLPKVENKGPKTLAEKRLAAIAWLGEKWVLHPNSKHNPRDQGFLQRWRIQKYKV
jgi:hypothetical protein